MCGAGTDGSHDSKHVISRQVHSKGNSAYTSRTPGPAIVAMGTTYDSTSESPNLAVNDPTNDMRSPTV